MTEGVTQAAAMPVAVHGPSGGRHGRRQEDAAGAFGEALGTSNAPHRAEAGAAAKPRANAWRQTASRPGAETAAIDDAHPKDGHCVKVVIDGKLTLTGSPDQPDDADAGEADVDDGLPTQMRAEQAISAFMTIAPIARQSTLAGGHGLQKEGAADAADSEIAASKESKAALAAGSEGTELEQQSRPRDASISNREAARPAAQSKDVVAEAAVAATSPRPAREHSATATGDAKANAAREAGQQATPADAAVPAATPIAGRPRSGGNDAGDPKQGESDGRSTSREARRTDPLAASAKVSIIAEQAAPAPAAASLSANGAAIVDAIGADSSWRAATHLSPALLAPSPNSAQPMRELKIQLHPLELGVVTVHLRTVGEQLSVELKVDNHDAYHRLNADSDAIIKSLRSLGFDIDSVSIQQPQAATTTVVRSEATADSGSFSRDTPSFQSGNSGNGSERSGGQTSGRGERGDAHGNDAASPLNRDRAGSSLYI